MEKHLPLGLKSILLVLLVACTARPPGHEPEAPRPPAEEPRAEERVTAPVVIGTILPETGSPVLTQYGELVRQGIDIAVREHARNGGRQVELVVLDDASDPARAGRLVTELERRQAVAIVGPLLAAALDPAGRARSDSNLVIISPTASERATRMPHVYTLNVPDTRGAEALASYAVSRGLDRVAMLYPNTAEFRAQAQAFRSALALSGARVAAEVPFDSGTTTFARPLQQLRSTAARAVFIPASERDIRQLAPQLEFYGLGGVQVLGSEAWVSDEVLRFVPARLLEGVIAATPLQRTSPSVAWGEFVGLYEATYRRTLDNPYPALGYDAATLILSSLPAGRTRPADVARALSRVDEFRGATGLLSAREGMISRRPFLVRIEGGRTVLAERSGS